MKQFNVTIIDPIGLHARPAAELVKVSSGFTSNISIKFNERTANAKSIITIMALGVKKDAEISFEIEGADEEAAAEAIKATLISSKIISE
ncbi:MAG: HPr family phosphocarrier protein [Mycoplasma sp.]